jgi:hypothetical protein
MTMIEVIEGLTYRNTFRKVYLKRCIRQRCIRRLSLSRYFVIQITSRATYHYSLSDKHSLLVIAVLSDIAVDAII